MKFYYNPISTYSQKALIALYEKGVAFEPHVVNLMSPEGRASYEEVYTVGKIPVLFLDDGSLLSESSAIVEYLELTHPNAGPHLVPADRNAALQTRRWTSFADSMLNETMQKIFFDTRRPAEKRDPLGVAQATAALEKSLAFMDAHLAKNQWLAGAEYSMADCAATPPLFYLKNLHPFEKFTNVTAYAARALERPAYLKVVAEAMPILQAMMKG